MKIRETFYPKPRTDWRKWLESHHADRQEIWLVYYKKHTGKPTIAYQDAVDEALCFGWIDGMDKRIDDERYAQRFTPRRAKSHWTEGNMKRYQALLEAGLMSEAGTKAFQKR